MGRLTMIAQGADGFQCHVAAALDGPLIVLFEQDRRDQSDDGGFAPPSGTTSSKAARMRPMPRPKTRSSSPVCCTLQHVAAPMNTKVARMNSAKT